MDLSVRRHAEHGAPVSNGVSNGFARDLPDVGVAFVCSCAPVTVRVTETKTVGVSLLPAVVRREAFAEASRFRGEFYACLTARRDELFELADTVLCADGAVKSVPGRPAF